MGMFDTIISQYKPLGDEFLGVDLQTKSLDNTMSTYWISPAGELFMMDWANSMEIVPNETDKKKDFILPLPFKWKPTGEHKKLTPVYYTGKLVVHPREQNGCSAWLYETWPEGTLLFKHGKVIYHETKTLQLSK